MPSTRIHLGSSASFSNGGGGGGYQPLPAWQQPGESSSSLWRPPSYSFVTWTFGRGAVIWRIWPAVLLHTTFAAGVVTIVMRGILDLAIPTIMLTVLGVVIGFVISYRASSGYDRYWMGKTYWTDVIKNSRTLGRLIWFHVPTRLTAKTVEEIEMGEVRRSKQEVNTVMAEKMMALDLIEGFSVALKHHLRGETGIYYEDLYHLIKPLHEHDHMPTDHKTQRALTSGSPPPHRPPIISAEHAMTQPEPLSGAVVTSPTPLTHIDRDPVIPPINAYGTFDLQKVKRSPNSVRSSSSPSSARSPSHASSTSSLSGISHHQPLLPANQYPARSLLGLASAYLIPFAGLFSTLTRKLGSNKQNPVPPVVEECCPQQQAPRVRHTWDGPVHAALSDKQRPRIAGQGENLPLEILRCLSEWFSVLEDRGTVPGTSLGAMVSLIAAFEENLTALERILTTPLPFVYSVHIRHTVWTYLFFLPFQLVHDFGYYTIPGVAIASFIYLGFLAAGEEIEQPFAYDDNDLDLDLFCHDIIHVEIQRLKMSPCLNAHLGQAQTQYRPSDLQRHAAMTAAGTSQNGHTSAD
ncbi:hypothetical protein AX17_003943 [Amanita inopinata Kibby_2008]|nr:hypothetical protein AX17_003943 [Amanita inopinata Kibby_2008]